MQCIILSGRGSKGIVRIYRELTPHPVTKPHCGVGGPVLFLGNPEGMTRQQRRMTIDKIRALNEMRLESVGNPEIETRIEQFELAYRMQRSVPELMAMDSEPAHIHEMYGTEPGKKSFANNCLLARRLVERGARFSQLTNEQRDEFIDRARQLANSGIGQPEIARQLASRTGRSVETIRTSLRQYDIEHPDSAIFPTGSGPLTELQKKNIFRAYRRGTSVDKLCRDFNRTKTTIYRVINEMRAVRIANLPLDFIPNPRFSRKGADNACLGPMPESETATRKPRRPSDLPPYLASLYEISLLTREQEQHLFRKYNYLKFKAERLRDQLDMENPKAAVMDEIEYLHEQIVDLKNQIARCNLRLVVSIAKRRVSPDQNFFELVSDGNLSLLRAVEKFDFARGNKFSTYASWAIMKNFARTIPGEYRHRDRFRTSHEELFSATEEERGNPIVEENLQQDRESKVQRILRRLDDREQKIIIGRFGLDHSREPLTLKQVGVELGVTKERIRQIEARALSKLRLAAQEEKIALDN